MYNLNASFKIIHLSFCNSFMTVFRANLSALNIPHHLVFIIYDTMDNQIWRTVPLKLLLVNELHYTTDGPKNTYSYCVLFDPSINAQNYKTDQALLICLFNNEQSI